MDLNKSQIFFEYLLFSHNLTESSWDSLAAGKEVRFIGMELGTV